MFRQEVVARARIPDGQDAELHDSDAGLALPLLVFSACASGAVCRVQWHSSLHCGEGGVRCAKEPSGLVRRFERARHPRRRSGHCR
eukprot:13162367-Alexandrium_andersonii.AAC.1